MQSQDWLEIQAERIPDKPAVISSRGTITYKQLYSFAGEIADAMSERGIKNGTHVGIVSVNSVEYVLCIHALLLLKAVIVPVNVRLLRHEMIDQIRFADCEFLITEDAWESEERIKQLQYFTFNDLKTSRSTSEFSSHAISPKKVCLLMYTSGTSGEPKCVMHSRHSLFYNALASKIRLQTVSTDSWLLALPIYHIGGFSIVIRSLVYGIPIIIPSGFQTDDIKNSIYQCDPAIVSLVPTMLQRLLDDDAKPNPSHKTILLGGGVISVQLVEEAQHMGWNITTTYGTTETGSQIATLDSNSPCTFGTVGRALPFSKIKIVDVSGKTIPVGTSGEIVVNTPSLMEGYYKNKEITERVLQNGWYSTGDDGYLTKEGCLTISSRRSDLIVSGGENINPVEVENVLSGHPDIRDVCVVPYTDTEWGEVPAAVIVSNKDAVTLESIKQFLMGKIASYKIPKKVFLRDVLPYTSTGKLQRDLVRRECTRIG